MELKRWTVYGRRGIEHVPVDIADYDSTKAALDTAEARIRNHKGRLDAICDRLSALEAKASYKKIDALERRINTLMGSITALEAKDAPRKYVLRQGGKVVRTFVDDLDTCGNCAKAWRQDGLKTVGCIVETGQFEYRHPAEPACPHYKRREA